MNIFLKMIFMTIGFIVYALLIAIFSGIVLADLWAWFINPIFNIGTLSIPQAIGISLIIEYLTYQTPTNKTTESSINLALMGIIKILFTWGLGWIVYQFI